LRALSVAQGLAGFLQQNSDGAAGPESSVRFARQEYPWEVTVEHRILVVDDEENICNYLAELFRLEGWEVDAAYDGYQGVKLAADGDYDIIIMDILMPRMTGIEATREIMKRRPEAKIIVITGAPYRRQAEEAMECGARLFIKKPFSSDKIIEAVKSLA